MPRFIQTQFWFVATIFIGLTGYVGFVLERANFVGLLAGWSAFFILYIMVWKSLTADAAKANRWLWLGIGLRGLLVFSTPNLSDDCWRFVWDGRLWLAGIHPFAQTPAFYAEHGSPTGLTVELFEKLNSKTFYTVYPPVCQAVFAVAAFLGKQSDAAAVVWMKLFLLACEVGTIRFLQKTNAQPEKAVLYALNPLAVFEIVGNCHFEGAVIFFLFAGTYFLEKQRVGWAALFWALAVSTKLLPLMFLPLLLPAFGWKKWLVFCGYLATFCVILFAPMVNWTLIKHAGESLDLYFQAFEFNASIYYILRPLVKWKMGFERIDLLGPSLAATAVLSILGLAWFGWRKIKATALIEKAEVTLIKATDRWLWTAMTIASTIQLIFSTTVHAWYVLIPFALSLRTGLWFVVAWTGLVVLSYKHYSWVPFHEDYVLLTVEYLLLAVAMIWNARVSRRKGGTVVSRY